VLNQTSAKGKMSAFLPARKIQGKGGGKGCGIIKKGIGIFSFL